MQTDSTARHRLIGSFRELCYVVHASTPTGPTLATSQGCTAMTAATPSMPGLGDVSAAAPHRHGHCRCRIAHLYMPLPLEWGARLSSLPSWLHLVREALVVTCEDHLDASS
jgi:hypothetical protein